MFGLVVAVLGSINPLVYLAAAWGQKFADNEKVEGISMCVTGVLMLLAFLAPMV